MADEQAVSAGELRAACEYSVQTAPKNRLGVTQVPAGAQANERERL